LEKHLDIKDELVQFAVENFTLLVQHSNFHTIQKDLLVNILREKFLSDLKIPNESSKLLVKNIKKSFQNSCWSSSGSDEEEEEEEESTPLSGKEKEIFNESLKRHAEKIQGSDEENEEEISKVESEVEENQNEEENLESEEFSEDE
jgi:gas vesicle protein